MVRNMKLNERVKENKGEHLLLEKPKLPTKNMLVEINNTCNHKCIFCSVRKLKRKPLYIKEDFLIRILKEAYVEGIREVGYYISGEPFLNPNLAKYIKIAKEIGYDYVYITTNGSLATMDKVQECVEAGLDSIKISINASNQIDYEFIHGKDDFHIVIDHIKQMATYKKENHLSFNLFTSTILTKYTANAKEELKELIGEDVDEMMYWKVGNQGGMLSDVIEELSVDQESCKKERCNEAFRTISITCEGYLSACCVGFSNYLIVADLNKVSLREAWEGEVFTDLRKRLLNNELDNTVCNNCMNNTCDSFEPLLEEYCTKQDLSTIYQDGELDKRKIKFDIG